MKHLKLSLVSTAALVMLSGCLGGGDSTPPNVAPTATDLAVTDAKTWLPLTGTFKVADGNGDTLTITKIMEGSAVLTATGGKYTLKTGTLEVKGLDFIFTPMSSDATTFSYTVSDGKLDATATVKIGAAASDPLVAQQWHLRNTGQRGYAMSDALVAAWSKYLQLFGGRSKAAADLEAANRIKPEILIAGEDINVAGAMALGATGQGTISVVVDEGMELRHEDLAANVLPGRSLNFLPDAIDSTDPTNPSPYGDHGTSVAGLIGAVGWNDKGGRGVAPNTKLIGMNFLLEQSALVDLLIHGHPGSGITVNEPLAVFNRSYGATFPVSFPYSEVDEAIQAYSATKLRGGKGAVNVKSSGNSFQSGRSTFENNLCSANGARTLGLTCYSSVMEPSQNTPYYFSVGAVNSDGKRTSYSTAGSNLLVAAPAGEFGVWEPAMVTTDQMTCLKGYSGFPGFEGLDESTFPGFGAGYYQFDSPGYVDNPSCNYTSTFNGTSSAAPNTSGVVALILSANPNLSYRDVRDILVKTSTKVMDKAYVTGTDNVTRYTSINRTVNLTTPAGTFLAHPGWVKNAAGFEFNNYYGFGRPNAGKAVEMAKAATPLGAQKMSGWTGVGTYAAAPASLARTVPDNSSVGATIQVNVTDDITLEGAQFKFAISNPEFALGFTDGAGAKVQTTAGVDLAIEVTSPSGTRSVLLASKQALILPALDPDTFDFVPGSILLDSVFLSNAFYGEKSKGTWTIKVLDVNGNGYNANGGYLQVAKYVNNSVPSVVDGVAVRVFGR